PNASDVTIGVAAGTELSISGVVRDDPTRLVPPAVIPDLHKILPGRLVLDNANTYRGDTFVDAGALNIRDSQALGTNGPTDATVYRITFGGSLAGANVPLMTATTTGNTTAVVNSVYGLSVSKNAHVSGDGLSFDGALHSISGLNTWTGIIFLDAADPNLRFS